MASDESRSHLNIIKGPSFELARPFVALYLPDSVDTLEDLREMLQRFKYISATEAFLDTALFPIHKEDEPDYKWSKVVIEPESAEGMVTQDTIHTGIGATMSVMKRSIVIVPRPSDGAPVPPAVGYGKPLADPAGIQGLKSHKGLQGTPGDTDIMEPVNVKLLNKEQLDEVFDINNIFSGVSGFGALAATKKIFEAPRDLSKYIWPYDDSHMEIMSTKVEGEASLLKQGTATFEIEASTKWLDFESSLTKSDSTRWKESTKEVYVVGIYRYPRAVIRLPLSMLNPTETFKNELAAALAPSHDEDLRKTRVVDFFRDYGQFFADEVYLGGHLHTSLSTKSQQEEEVNNSKTAIRAGLAFPFGMKLGGEYSKVDENAKKTLVEASQYVVEAVGGDTLRMDDIPRWCASVMPHENWRITKRSGLKLLIDIPSLVSTEQKVEILKILEKKA